jgi:lysyl-tRNA synthetase class 1
LEDAGAKTELVWISDDMDPFRSVPADMPEELANYLGLPACSIPDFWNCHESFTEHFENKFIQQLKTLLIEPKILLGIEMYRKGMYNEMIKLAMEKRNEIAKILNKFRKEPLPENWYPVNIICENCGKISTTKIISYDPKSAKASYVCSEEEVLLHKKHEVKGCGFIGESSVLNGRAKLTWRVEWPARWVFLKATCEPFGKEHAAAGGSWDTGKEIVKLLGWKPVYPVIYEHFLVEGKKMSKSKGNVITVPQMLKYLKPEQIRYWMLQGRLTIAKDIKLAQLVPQITNEFDKAERIYFGLETTKNKRKDQNFKRAYKLAITKPKKSSIQIPFEILVEIAKILPEKEQIEFAIEKLKEFGYVKKVNATIKKEIEKRLNFAKNWYEDFGKPKVIEKIELTEKERDAVAELIKTIEIEVDGEELQTKIFEIARLHKIKPEEFFKLIYKIILKSEAGPRLGPYIIRIKDEVIKKLKEVL